MKTVEIANLVATLSGKLAVFRVKHSSNLLTMRINHFPMLWLVVCVLDTGGKQVNKACAVISDDSNAEDEKPVILSRRLLVLEVESVLKIANINAASLSLVDKY